MIYIPVIVALIIKFMIIYWYRRSLTTSAVSRTFLGLLIVLTVSNSIELTGYYYGTALASTVLLLKCYYVALFWLFAFLLQIAILIVNNKLSIRWTLINYLIAAMMSGTILFSNVIIAGAESIGYTVTRIPGAYYWVAQVYAMTMLVSSIGISIIGYRAMENHFVRIRCMYLLLAICCLATPILIAITMMALGFKLSAAVILPIGISLFLVILSYALSRDKIYDIRMWVPFTQIFKLHVALHKEYFVSFDGSEMSAKERKAHHEKQFLIRALITSDGNQSKAAELLKMSKSNLSYKCKAYGIKQPNYYYLTLMRRS